MRSIKNVALLTEDGALCPLFSSPPRWDLPAEESPPPGICHPRQKKATLTVIQVMQFLKFRSTVMTKIKLSWHFFGADHPKVPNSKKRLIVDSFQGVCLNVGCMTGKKNTRVILSSGPMLHAQSAGNSLTFIS